MKKTLLLAIVVFSLSCFASVEPSEVTSTRPSETEVTANRVCFQELERAGCGDPADDIVHFRSCMNNVYKDLTKDCQALMKDLYKSK